MTILESARSGARGWANRLSLYPEIVTGSPTDRVPVTRHAFRTTPDPGARVEPDRGPDRRAVRKTTASNKLEAQLATEHM